VNEQILDHVWNASGIRLMGDGVPGAATITSGWRTRRGKRAPPERR